MRAIKEARKYIERKPKDAQAQTLSRLVLALQSEADFPITELYQLDLDRFNLALQILEEWRLDRYYASKARLLDVSLRLSELSAPQPATVKPAAKTTAKTAPKTSAKTATKPVAKTAEKAPAEPAENTPAKAPPKTSQKASPKATAKASPKPAAKGEAKSAKTEDKKKPGSKKAAKR